jgi:pyruvyl transferase EpsI
LSPDLVTYLDDLLPSNNNQRKGALFLLRKDGEKSLEFKTRNQFISSIQKEYNKYDISDTNFLQLSINSITESKEEVSMILKNISKYEIVITDRLHGMIFSVITKTSCIVIKSYNHKISSSYNWFKHLDYIKLLNSYNIKEFQNLIYYFKKKITKNIYNKNIFNDYYE